MLTKQAKILSEDQIELTLNYLKTTRYPLRNKVIFLLSLHGLRSKEIAELEILMVSDSTGEISEVISLTNKASKGHSGRLVYMNATLQAAIKEYLASRTAASKYLITTERSEQFSPNAVAVWFKRLYKSLNFQGASSHSGRRTFITNSAKKISLVGGSLRDVMALAGHAHLSTTQRYIEQDSDAQRKVVSMLYQINP